MLSEGPSRRSAAPTRKPASAKRKGPPNRILPEAKQILEEEFATNPYPCSWEIDIIAHQANLDTKRVKNWFNNSRARKKCSVSQPVSKLPNDSTRSLASKLSSDSLEALDKLADGAPQPPLAVYLASSYREEAANLLAIQAAIESGSSSNLGDTFMDSSSGSRHGKNGSVITSIASSEGTSPSTYTMSSSGSNISSFGRDRRRGRRRTWRAAPYSRAKFSGMNSAGIMEEDLPFFCTFCPRAFKTKYEWIRHEDSVHALRTTWICCDTKHEPLQSCLFCGEAKPSDAHMSTHRYQQCRNKPESQRTFYRRDHFVQHLHHVHFSNVKHPTVSLGCQTRLTGCEDNGYGCKELAMKWRRFGAPMKREDPMLHCGFCGKKTSDWSERCNHVSEHLIAGDHDRSAWWDKRLENHLENLCSPRTPGPFRCRYCKEIFVNVDAMNKHTHCRVWSCRFLQTSADLASENAGPPLCPQFPSAKAHHCHICGAGYQSSHVDHAQSYHRYRLCKQDLYTSEAGFLQHLYEFHGSSQPQLLQNSVVIEQQFSRNKGASFEPVDFDEIIQGYHMPTEGDPLVDPSIISETLSRLTAPGASLAVSSISSPPRRKTRDRMSSISDISAKVRRQRSKKSSKSSEEITPAFEPPEPRFFRRFPLVPFLSPKIYYLRNAKPCNLFGYGKSLLEEVPCSHIASLVMCSGLVGMAGVRWPVKIKTGDDDMKGVVELALDD
ncbi:hypothetical protein K504DRAFT_392824 [Pleomassaria siparia CBS 279.74]|uniref:Homeobox domain-containing protein n=1 Tax=Pleomassaria siparia CBS 279.74 TaxID=1314801 RepID=A0A6G1JSR9_9PLEO|nr:hypothetical protein K504DRAFT_392824 [Pleomassaria siparia CBS 279.74]